MQAERKFIFVRHEGKYIRVNFAEILYLESVKNFVKLHYSQAELLLLITLCQLERELPGSFCRVHRSYIVNTDHIRSFDSVTVSFGAKSAPVARRFKSVLPRKMQVINPENRTRPLLMKMQLGNSLN